MRVAKAFRPTERGGEGANTAAAQISDPFGRYRTTGEDCAQGKSTKAMSCGSSSGEADLGEPLRPGRCSFLVLSGFRFRYQFFNVALNRLGSFRTSRVRRFTRDLFLKSHADPFWKRPGNCKVKPSMVPGRTTLFSAAAPSFLPKTSCMRPL
jgi:hypothetical protein